MLSEDVRSELAAIAPRRRCDCLAETSALFHTAGSLHLRSQGEVSFHLDVASSAVARRAFALLRELAVASEIRTYRQPAFGRPVRYQLHVLGHSSALDLLRQAGVVSAAGAPLVRPPRRVTGRACCRAAYLRGAILGSGSVSGPRSPHVEVRCATLEGAQFLVEIAASEGVELSARERGRFALAYARGGEQIADLLALAGASDAALSIDEYTVVAAARAAGNRLANADHANLVRTSRAAHRQLEAVRALARRGRLRHLPPELQEIAELRLRHPSAPLRDLATKCRPAVTKAAAQRRLAKLIRLAES